MTLRISHLVAGSVLFALQCVPAFAKTYSTSTAPQGLLYLELPKTTLAEARIAFTMPLRPAPTWVGAVGYATTERIGVESAAWVPGTFGRSSSPFLVRFLSGAQGGRTCLVLSNTVDSLTLDIDDQSSDSTPLVGKPGFRVRKGDRFEIVPVDTLSTLFGEGNEASSLVLTGGSSQALSDVVEVADPTSGSLLRFWFEQPNNGPGHWRKVGEVGTFDQFLIYPESALWIIRKPGREALSLALAGRVPTVGPLLRTEPGNPEAEIRHFSLGLPVPTTLGKVFSRRFSPEPGRTAETADHLYRYATDESVASFWLGSLSGKWRSAEGEPSSALILAPTDLFGISTMDRKSGRFGFLRVRLPYHLNN